MASAGETLSMHNPLPSLGLAAQLAFALLLLPGLAQGSSVEDPIQLQTGDSQSLRIGLPQLLCDAEFPSLQIEVPKNALAIRVWTTGATGDVTFAGTHSGVSIGTLTSKAGQMGGIPVASITDANFYATSLYDL